MSGFQIIDPETVTDSVLSSTNVSETVSTYSATTYYVTGDTVRSDSTHKVYEALIGDAAATVTITNASPGVVTQTAHGLVANDVVIFTTTGTLPTGLSPNTAYYVRNPTTNTYEVSATSGGTSINTSSVGSGTHTAHGNANYGNDPTSSLNSAYWLDTGATNPWAMFDQYLESQTTNADTIEVTVIPTGRVGGMALFNIDAANVTVTVTDGIDGTVYGPTVYDLVYYDNSYDYYSYCFATVIRKTALYINDLPPYLSPDITVVIDNTGSTAKCGALIFGSISELGATVYGAELGIIDHSLKTTDDFGNTTITQRSYRKTGNFRVIVEKALVDEVARFLAERRAVFSVFAATDQYSAALIYGFPRDWRVVIEHQDKSALNIQIEGVS